MMDGLEEAEDDSQYRRFWPLDGECYIQAYYTEGSRQIDQQEVLALIESIKKYKTVSYTTLKACWPAEYLQDGVPEISFNEPCGQEEVHVVPPLSLYTTMKLQYIWNGFTFQSMY